MQVQFLSPVIKSKSLERELNSHFVDLQSRVITIILSKNIYNTPERVFRNIGVIYKKTRLKFINYQ